MRLLALGDSYTIGEGVDKAQSWPFQLVNTLRDENFKLDDPVLIAKTGWTTEDLLAAINEIQPQGPFELVTLLIGVNNQYQGKDAETYRLEFRTLLSLAIGFANGNPTKVLVLSIPDWSVTPFAQGRDPDQIRAEIDRYNAINRAESQAAGVNYVEITSISRQAADDSSLLAPDALHPSEKMYAAWVEQILPQVINILK